MVERQMIVFDFDGVLMHSREEVVLNSYNAVTGELVVDREELPPNFRELFLRNSCFVQPAGDFLLVAEWCLHHLSSPEQTLTEEGFGELLRSETTPLKDRTAQFFSARDRFFTAAPERWVRLHSVFEPLWSTVKNLSPSIITNKNRAAVLALAGAYGLEVQEENLLAGDDGVKKAEHISTIKARHPDCHLLFLDDSLLNLRELQLAHRDLTLLLASWGYLAPTDLALAPTFNIRPVSQLEVIELLKSQTK